MRRMIQPKGKHYKIYYNEKLPSKSELIQRAFKIISKTDVHEEFIDFVPAKFVLQLHGWGDILGPRELSRTVRANIKKWHQNSEINKALGGKWHFDIRVQKLTAPSWHGITTFSNPMKATAERKAQGTTKGFEILTKEGKKLHKKWRSSSASPEGLGTLDWLNVGFPHPKYWRPDAPGNPSKNWPAAMIGIDKGKAVIHRRERDFFDITFIGRLLRGRTYCRLVNRKLSEEEKTKTYKGPEVKYFWYFWPAKKEDQFDPRLMQAVADLQMSIKPIRAPKEAK